MTSKERSYLMHLAQALEPVVQIGKSGLTPEITRSVEEAFNNRELIKVNIQKGCPEDPAELSRTVAERTHSQPVQIIGRKLVLYRQAKEPADRKIVFPK